jgi:hypothetical protein
MEACGPGLGNTSRRQNRRDGTRYAPAGINHMLVPLAYSMSYGSAPTADQMQFRFWLFIVLLSLPALAVYAVSKIEGDEFKSSLFTWLLTIPLLLAIIAPTAGPAPVWVGSLGVLLLCSSLELFRYGWPGIIKGCIGLPLGVLVLRGAILSSFADFMMTGDIF